MRSIPMSKFPAKPHAQGFTLVEISIVLVIVGLMLAGVFKGQSLIDSARVSSMASEVSGIRSAWYSFQDRYRALPGDFQSAGTQIDSAAVSGNGNGKIDGNAERAGVWQQLSLAGFINGSFDGEQAGVGSASNVDCAAGTCPKNPFNGYYKISYSAQAADVTIPSHEIFTGSQIPVGILAELDRKLDDGAPTTGRFRVHRSFQGACTRNSEWDVSTGHTNCAGVLRD